MMKKPIILFDLDGTLLDTAPDLGFALNQLLLAHKHPSLSLDIIRPVASHGSKGLLKLGFKIDDSDPIFEDLKRQLLAIYSDNIANYTALFPEMKEVLQFFSEHGYTWGIVTNKPGWLTEPLLQQIKLPFIPHCIVSGDTVTRAKPYPDPLLHACKILNCEPQDCIYIGDAQRDIQAGNAAGMKTLIAHYGYLSMDDEPATWQADGVIYTPKEIMDWVK